MKRDLPDYFYVESHQLAIHGRLVNWARWVDARGAKVNQHPMWRQGKSNSRQWHSPEPREPVNSLDGLAMEKAVGALPIPHREAIRWYYVWKTSPMKARRSLGVTAEGLMKLVKDARSMLANRAV